MAKPSAGRCKSMLEPHLPAAFRDLEPWLAWSLATERERSAKRQSSTMAEIKAFYETMLARMEAILPYLEQFPPDNVPLQTERLFYLTLSLAEVAPAAELYGQPGVVDGFDVSRFTPGNE